jgi:hypothetical protein
VGLCPPRGDSSLGVVQEVYGSRTSPGPVTFGKIREGGVELTAFSCDMLIDSYAATATSWKVELTTSEV